METLYELRWERPAALYLAAKQLADERGKDPMEIIARARELPGWVGGAAFLLFHGSGVMELVLRGLEAGARPGEELVREAAEILKRHIS